MGVGVSGRELWREQGGRCLESEGMLAAMTQAPHGPGGRHTALCWSGSGGFLEETALHWAVSQAGGGSAVLPGIHQGRSWAEEELGGQVGVSL